MTNKDDNECSIARYSSLQINRGLELARKVSIATVKTDSPQKINIEQIHFDKYMQDAEYFLKVAMQQITPTEYQYALANIQKAIDIKPDYYEAYIVRYSMIYLPLGCYQEAIDDCNQILQINPKNAEILTSRGLIYAQLGYHIQALKDYDSAILITPDVEMVYMNRGLSYIYCNNFYNAINDFQYILNINPNDANAHNNKGLCLLHLHQYLEAIDEFDRAIKINSDLVTAYLNKGVCYLSIGEEQKGADNFSIGFMLDPEYSKGFFEQLNENGIESVALMFMNSGLLAQEESNYHTAINFFNSAIYLDLTYKEAYYATGTVKFRLSDRNNSLAYILRAKSCYELGDYSQYQKDSIKGYTLLSQEQLCSEDYQGAIESFSNILELDPTNADAYNKRSTARSAVGDYQGAIEDLNKVRMMN
jgi:tetratricopeptide (TPR) repeat protein